MGVNRRVLALQKYSGSPPGLNESENLREFFCGAGLVNHHLACVGLPLRLLGKNDIVMLDIYTHRSDVTQRALIWEAMNTLDWAIRSILRMIFWIFIITVGI